MNFLDSLDNFACAFDCDPDFFLRKFSKSLTDGAYTWYVNLVLNMAYGWEDLVWFQYQMLIC